MARAQYSYVTDTPLVVMLGAYALLYTAKASPNQQILSEPVFAATSSLVSPPMQECEFNVGRHCKNWVKFQSLVSRWQNERGVMSSITEMSMLPAYQKIIGMGEDAIPLIIAELKSEGDEPDQWFWALKAITAADPVRPQDQGDFPKMAQSWIKWAEDEGYVG